MQVCCELLIRDRFSITLKVSNRILDLFLFDWGDNLVEASSSNTKTGIIILNYYYASIKKYAKTTSRTNSTCCMVCDTCLIIISCRWSLIQQTKCNSSSANSGRLLSDLVS